MNQGIWERTRTPVLPASRARIYLAIGVRPVQQELTSRWESVHDRFLNSTKSKFPGIPNLEIYYMEFGKFDVNGKLILVLIEKIIQRLSGRLPVFICSLLPSAWSPSSSLRTINCTIYLVCELLLLTKEDSIKGYKMSKGVISFSSLDYLHKGVQDTAQRQIDEFDTQIQSHFDWLASYDTSNKSESMVYVQSNVFLLQNGLFLLSMPSFLHSVDF